MLTNTRTFVMAAVAATVVTLSASAQDSRPSPPDKAQIELKGKTLVIDYCRPSMRGRKIFGALVPYGQIWRTGANEATSFSVPLDIQIGDLAVPAGKYTIYTLPSEKQWKLIINKQTGQWGTEYAESDDLGRVNLKKTSLDSPLEKFTIRFENKGENADLILEWEKTRLSVPVRAK